ncbi:MAG: hypothetical protein UV65_C0027G0012 [Parcubacteria group bacterium GW2011_GWF2_43_11]|nr:MAG: hypothetical protein UV65_C0027G0012 [Parcubacteria group bacterium GW2011_GWF2_43_11]
MVEQRFCKAKVWGFESSLRLLLTAWFGKTYNEIESDYYKI